VRRQTRARMLGSGTHPARPTALVRLVRFATASAREVSIAAATTLWP
jgi:hypothetical protein